MGSPLGGGRHAVHLALLTASLAFGGCGGEVAVGDDTDGARALGGAVASPTSASTDAGLQALAAGGNAVDAAAAISFALTVTQPSRAGLGGRGLLLVRTPEGSVHVVRSGAEDHPSSASPERASPAADTVPASPDLVRVLELAVERFGSGHVEWDDLVEPSVRLAEDGFLLGREEHRARVRNLDRLARDRSSAELLLRADGSAPTERSRVRVPALAATLRRLARAGPGDFYRGDLAERIGEAAEESGRPGLLEGPTPVVEDPETGSYRGWRVAAAPARPGGERVLRSLGVLRLAAEEVLAAPGIARTLWLAEALTFGTFPAGDAGAWVSGRPPLPRSLTADTAGASGTPRPRAGRPAPQRIAPAPMPPGPPAAATTFAVLDGYGGVVVGILSMGREYGTGRTAADLGFFFSTAGAHGDAGTAAVAFRDDSIPAVAAGAPGIVAADAVVQVITAWIDGGLPLDEAVSLPRLQILGDTVARPHLFLEGVSWSRGILDEIRRWSAVPDSLRRRPADPASPAAGGAVADGGSAYWGGSLRDRMTERGYLLAEWPETSPGERLDPRFGEVQAVASDGGTAGWEAASDRRGEGTTRIVSPEEAAVTSVNRRP